MFSTCTFTGSRSEVSSRPGDVRRGILQLGMQRDAFQLPGIPPDEWGPELRAAVVQAVEQEAWLGAPEDWGELHVELYDAVWAIAELGDPVAIGPLADFGLIGFDVYDWLVFQGVPALREVIATAKRPGSTRARRGSMPGSLRRFAGWRRRRSTIRNSSLRP